MIFAISRLVGLVLGVGSLLSALDVAQGQDSRLRIATLHPLLTDIAQNVGGNRVDVVSLLKPGGDPHHYAPSPGDLSRIRNASLVLASGKGLEPYLDRLAANLSQEQRLIEVGRRIPSIKIEVGELFTCCPAHSKGSVDPHWWHSIANVSRAARHLSEEFSNAAPEHRTYFQENSRAYIARLSALKQWAERELSVIPRSNRDLVTAHAAFGYFCKEFGFRSIPVLGLSGESDPSPQYLSQTIEALRKNRVKAVFPEHTNNPKVLSAIVAETGVKVGEPLIADGTGEGDTATFEGMMRHNIHAIVNGLR